MKKKIISLVLVLLMVVGLLPFGVLATESSAAWDGTTKTEPALVDGVYQIGTAEELAWFGAQTSKTGQNGISAVLTDDIDLGGHDWFNCMIGATSTYGNGYSGTFDGAGHTISGFSFTKNIKGSSSATYGLFGYAAKAYLRTDCLSILN